MAATTSTPSASSILEELDHAIAEHRGLVGDFESESDQSIEALHELRKVLVEVGDQPLDEITLGRINSNIPVPNWLPRSLTNALRITADVSASEAQDTMTYRRWSQLFAEQRLNQQVRDQMQFQMSHDP